MKKETLRKETLYELKKKSPGVAALLSLVINGAGQMYCGKWGRGFIFMATTLVLWILMLGWIMWIICPIDAYYLAGKQNNIMRLEMGLETIEQ